MAETVHISARILTFPNLCACCCCQPDTKIPFTATRTKGVRVIHTDWRSWLLPYCTRCLNHVQLVTDIANAETTVEEWRAAMWAAQSKQGEFNAKHRFWKILRFPMAVPGAFLLPIVAVASPFVGDAYQTMLTAITAVGAGVLGSAAGFGLALLLAAGAAHKRDEWGQAAAGHAVGLAAAEQHLHATREQCAATMTPLCAAAEYAAEYHGWDGTIHEFTFESDGFVRAFRDANYTKRQF